MTKQALKSFLALAVPTAGLADVVNNNVVLQTNQAINLDTGAVVSSGGDMKWTGTTFAPQGNAKAFFAAGGDPNYGPIDPSLIKVFPLSSAPILGGALTATAIVVGISNGGNYWKLEVLNQNALSGGPLNFKFQTFTTGGGGPTISKVVNNSSLIPPGSPNSGLVGSSIIQIQGNNLSDPVTGTLTLEDSSKSGGLPTTLRNASATVASGGKTLSIAWYYTSPTQSAGVLPAAVQPGPATLTYTYNGQSTTFPINVVTTAFGVDTYENNLVVAQFSTSPTGALIDYLHSAKTGDFATVWGSGLLANAADSDTTYTSTPQASNVPVQIFLAGVPVTEISYAGDSVYPGVQILVFKIPPGVPDGCFDPLAIVTGSNPVLSNMGYLPKNDKGNLCMDPYTGLTGDQISSLVTQTNIRSGSVFVGQTTGPSPTGGGTQTTAGAFATFQQVTGTSFGATGGFVTVGSCFISQTAGGGGTATVTGLDAGTITMNGPGGTSTLQTFPQVAGTYIGQLSSIPPAATFTFHGSGGSGPNSIGPFDTSVNFPAQLLTWTNQTAGSTVNRNSGVTFNWSGGSPGTFVVITGSSSDGKVSGSFTCIAPVEAQSFNVKSFITQAMPAGSGTLSIQNSTSFRTFSANGLGQGISGGFTSTMINATYQ